MTNKDFKDLDRSKYYHFIAKPESASTIGRLIIETENAVDKFYVTDFNAMVNIQIDPKDIIDIKEVTDSILLFKDRTSDLIDIPIGTSKVCHFEIKGDSVLEELKIQTQTRNYEVEARILFTSGQSAKYIFQIPSNNKPYNLMADVANLSSIGNIILIIRPEISYKEEEFIPLDSIGKKITNLLFHLSYSLHN
jgi:hypothetical protein